MTRAGRIRLALLGLSLATLPTTALAPAAPGPTRLVKGPYVTSFSDTTADVRFELDAPGPATLEIGADRSTLPLRKIADNGPFAMHVVHVTGLTAGRPYTYGITLGAAIIGRGDVTTAPSGDSSAPVRFLVSGDNRSDPSAHAAIIRAMGATPSDFVLNTGDIVEDGGSASDWQSFFTVEAPLLRERPMLLCIGNHELYDDEAGANFARYFGFPDASGTPRPYGTARVGRVRLFFLNGMHDWEAGDERDWLDRELRSADAESGLVWRIAVIHHGPWSAGPHGPNPRLLAAHVPELLTAHKVDLVISGHDHIYERGEVGSIKYIVSGGGGAPLYRIASPAPMTRKAEAAYHFVDITATPTDLRIVAQRVDGTVLDKCGFAKGAGWDCDAAPGPLGPSQPPGTTPGAAPAPPTKSSRCSLLPAGPGTGPRGPGDWPWALIATAGVLGAWMRRRRG